MDDEKYQDRATYLLLLTPITLIVALAGVGLAARGLLGEEDDVVETVLSIGLGVGMVFFGLMTTYNCVRVALGKDDSEGEAAT